MSSSMNGSSAKDNRRKVGNTPGRVRLEDERDDDMCSRREVNDRREDQLMAKKSAQSKASPKERKGKHSHHSPRQQRPYMHEGFHPTYSQPSAGRGVHYPNHRGMHGGSRGPPPGPYPHPHAHHYYSGNPGAPHDHFRGPHHPHHYHQMPPLPHPGQPGHYGGRNGLYAHPPNMSGRPGPPPGYHPNGYGGPYPGPLPHMGYHGAPPPPSYHGSQQASDSNSISSSRSKRSNKSHSSNGSRKKRTIEGFHDRTKDKSVPLSYSFRRTNSSSSNSTTTASKTMDQSIAESPNKRERSSSRASNYLPPMSRSANIFEESDRPPLQRSHSGNSTASSLSGGGFSLSSYEGSKAVDDVPMLKASPKRRKGSDSAPVLSERSDDTKSIFKRKGNSRMANASDQSIEGAESSRFRQLSVKDSENEEMNDSSNRNIFLSLSTSPINHRDVDETPISKNTNRKKKLTPKITVKTDMDEVSEKPRHDSLTDTPTPPNMLQNEMMTDEHTLNKHLRGQSFTPLPHAGETGISPSAAAFSAIAPSLSWSIAGDTPSLEDLAGCSWEESSEKGDRRRPDSTTSHLSSGTSNVVISPHHFTLWKEDHESKKKSEDDENDKEDGESIRLSMLSPNSEIAMSVDRAGGTTTPLPIFFRDSGSDERENHHSDRSEKRLSNGKDMNTKGSHPEQLYHSNSVFVDRRQKQPNHQFFSHGPPRDGLPPTPVYTGSKAPTPHYPVSNMGVGFARSPLHGERRDFAHMFNGHHPPPGPHNDRIRNLRGRMPPGAHMAPVPIHIPPPMSTHHPLTSPMGLPGPKPMWSPHQRGMVPPMASPHHMSPMDITQSKRKCVPLKPPIPSKFQGDMEKFRSATVPEFTSLVNFPVHMSQKQAVNLPEGMRCCVMCGSACPCSSGNKKKGNGSLGNKKDSRGNNGQDISGDKNGYAIIPTQNKGLCTLCDVNVWVVANSGLEIKWCKGCKNFRPWAAFGDKGLATKCLRCRERQREKYALQKEEKEKARLQKSAKAKA
eukprot:CAMPEP_0197194148 /NCGR_PEP_ID=MMETSP1423-20130617/28701_1 /TAXON_ID=476441 /ORGANISM="Pseudo-nitzschia heimii, Strain UNC1101" /LENGTH=1009 /DNA_ID=CAMNT_0042647521 /DNA_START=111 /DNA_END=3140 /DNA_ORIENTATION=+